MLRTLIVDDEPPARRVLEILSRDVPLITVVGSAADGLEALALIASEPIDLMLADIAMPSLSGLELVAKLPPERAPAVIFVTAYAEHALRAFELGAVGYLLKPVDVERLAQAVQRVSRQRAASSRLWPAMSSLNGITPAKTHIWIDMRGRQERVEVDTIDLLRAEDDYVRVVTAERSYLVPGPLEKLALELGSGFARVHRSTVVRLAAVHQVGSDASRRLILTMRSGETVSVSRRTVSQLRPLLR